MARIEIKDLPVGENLSPEQEALLLGAGFRPFHPTFEALEAREMMDAAIGHALLAPLSQSGGAAPQLGHTRILASDFQTQGAAHGQLQPALPERGELYQGHGAHQGLQLSDNAQLEADKNDVREWVAKTFQAEMCHSWYNFDKVTASNACVTDGVIRVKLEVDQKTCTMMNIYTHTATIEMDFASRPSEATAHYYECTAARAWQCDGKESKTADWAKDTMNKEVCLVATPGDALQTVAVKTREKFADIIAAGRFANIWTIQRVVSARANWGDGDHKTPDHISVILEFKFGVKDDAATGFIELIFKQQTPGRNEDWKFEKVRMTIHVDLYAALWARAREVYGDFSVHVGAAPAAQAPNAGQQASKACVAFGRYNLLEQARVAGVSVSTEELQHAADAFRRSTGLNTAADTQAWLTQRGVAAEDFEGALEASLLAGTLRPQLSAVQAEAEPR
jgi:hypothetical protein